MKTFLTKIWMIRNGRLEHRETGEQPSREDIRTDPILRVLHGEARQRNPDAPNVRAFLNWMDS